MYLKAIEMTGFKSFADKTKLEFEPAMTAIVGPNGCGKSNISDAVRWVLGEQSAKSIRGSTMEDCIFSGTDDRKPLGMAEVSLTLADCETTLDTEYDEMTITRRALRSGEGQYFVNKTPCRLKDIQRLFMDTGVGTTSYSIMEQGRIDRILSSRPEDRRTVFEEASGITKFKADRKEAIRKLEYTEANLLRLADVIREVKRQIGSLQRQAGKARRYKAHQGELRKLDIFLAKRRLRKSDSDIKKLEAAIVALLSRIEEAQAEITGLERDAASLRESLVHTERDIGAAHEAKVQAQSKLDHTREVMTMNQQRIEEYRSWSERDGSEIQGLNSQIEEKERILAEVQPQVERARAELSAAENEMGTCSENFELHRREMDEARGLIQRQREEGVELESLSTRLQNQLVEIESKERATVIQREHLLAEKAQFGRLVGSFEERQADMARALEEMSAQTARSESVLGQIQERKATGIARVESLRQTSAELQSTASAARARAEFLEQRTASGEDLSAGNRLLLDESNPLDIDRTRVLGPIADQLDAEPDYRTALEAALRAWLDAVLVADSETALDILRKLESGEKGAVRIIADTGRPSEEAPSTPGAERLLDHVNWPEAITPTVRRLLGNVLVVDSLDAVPSPPPDGSAFVTRSGSVVRADGCHERWAPDARVPNPMSTKHLLAEAQSCLAGSQAKASVVGNQLSDLKRQIEALEESGVQARTELDESRRRLAQKEGQSQVVGDEATEARQRLDTVEWELRGIATESQSGVEERKRTGMRLEELRSERERVTREIRERGEELGDLESRHSEAQSEMTDHRVRCAGLRHRVEQLETQRSSLATRIDELRRAAQGRSRDIRSYQDGEETLTRANADAELRLDALRQASSDSEAKVQSLSRNRTKQAAELEKMEGIIGEKRHGLEAIRSDRSEQEVALAENRTRHQNQIDRVTAEYRMTLAQVLDEEEPEWQDGEPGLDAAETAIAELRTKLEAMGPVNLVAIEQYGELEERCAFLTSQEADLTKAKQQLMDLIRRINRTTSEMFGTTFAAINENFQAMFQKLFNGGSAKLVLVNEEDILECGIEIIARPPGKKLQNISLLSGGERTLTALALLFAIYMIKPSPFCLLDELDAPLDDSNIGRFIAVLQDFLRQSQFVIITHNQHTISAAKVLYGVTMPEKGVSKIVSMRFKRDRELIPAS